MADGGAHADADKEGKKYLAIALQATILRSLPPPLVWFSISLTPDFSVAVLRVARSHLERAIELDRTCPAYVRLYADYFASTHLERCRQLAVSLCERVPESDAVTEMLVCSDGGTNPGVAAEAKVSVEGSCLRGSRA